MNIKKWLTLACLALATAANAEIFQGILWFDSLDDVKAKFPNASFVSEKVAWLQPNEAFYRISGPGMVGTLRILFDDSRPVFKDLLQENKGDPEYDKTGSFKRLANQPEGQALTVGWVRWIPERPIPLDRYKQRYGTPTCEFDEQMSPICKWPSHELTASMTEDQKNVNFVTSAFTKAEKRSIYIRKFGKLPDWLK